MIKKQHLENFGLVAIILLVASMFLRDITHWFIVDIMRYFAATMLLVEWLYMVFHYREYKAQVRILVGSIVAIAALFGLLLLGVYINE